MEKEIFNLPNELSTILDKYNSSLEKRKEFELVFNVFTFINQDYTLEEYHSDIIAAFLKYKSKEGNYPFLKLFIELINEKNQQLSVDVNQFKDVIVERETHRIDILIQDRNTQKTIIIENKINNAIDQDRQLPRYVTALVEKDNLAPENIIAIIYLPLDPNKNPAQDNWSEIDKGFINNRLVKIPAFNNDNFDLVNGWLSKCKEYLIGASFENSKEIEVTISQYISLLKSIKGFSLDTEAIKEYYNFLQTKKEVSKEMREKMKAIEDNFILYYPILLKEIIDNNTSANLWYGESLLQLGNEIIFDKIGGDNVHYLKITFSKNNDCVIRLMDNTQDFVHDDKLRINDNFISLFDEEDDEWRLKSMTFDLINDFNKFSDKIEFLLNEIANTVRSRAV